MKFLGRNWFIIGIFTALILGIAGNDVGLFLNRGAYFSNTLVVLLFIITGLKLPVDAVKNDLKDVRVHLLIQLFIFVAVPLYFYISTLPLRGVFGREVIIGIYALAVLPCTISSCIVFTQSAGGNVVATMFNTAFANIMGVALSPLLLSLMMRTSSGLLPSGELIGILKKLALLMLLPIAAGQIMRIWSANIVEKYKKQLGIVSNIFILMILFFAFSKSSGNPGFIGNLKLMVLPYSYLGASFLLLAAGASGISFLAGFSREDRISVVFTAPQKTLAMGVPLLSTYFASNPELLGTALLPLIFYHPWQLLVSGVLQQRIISRSNKKR